MRTFLTILLATSLATSLTAADYPCWRGPTGSGAARPCGEPLVDSLVDAQLVWRSDEVTPNVYPEGWSNIASSILSGQAGPVVYNGRVYLWYFEPNDEVYDSRSIKEAEENMATGKGKAAGPLKALIKQGFDWKRKFAIRANEVVLCLDATSGKTLWKTVYRRDGVTVGARGRSAYNGAKTGPHGVACAAYGKVCVLGTTHRVYCLDAATGEPLWQRKPGDLVDTYERYKDYGVRTRSLAPAGREDVATCPTYAAGCFIVGCGNDLVAYDAQTGQERWRIDGVSVPAFSPLRCMIDDEEFIMSGGGALIDPREGKVLWRAGINNHICVGDGYLVGRNSREKEEGPRGYRMSKTEAKHLWTLDAKKYSLSAFRIPAISNGRLWASAGGGNTVCPVYSVDLATGKAIEPVGFWGAGCPNRSSSSVVMTDNRMFLERADLIHLDQATGAMKVFDLKKSLPADKQPTQAQRIPGHNDLNVGNSCTPAIADGRLYLRLHDGLACLDLRKTPKPMPANPAVAGPDPVATKLGLADFGSAHAVDREAAIAKAAATQVEALGQLAAQGRWQSAVAACQALRTLEQQSRPAAKVLADACVASVPTSPSQAALLAATVAAIDPAAAEALAKQLGALTPSLGSCRAAGGLGEHGRAAEAHLRQALDVEGAVRREAIQALIHIGGRQAETAQRLAALGQAGDIAALRAVVAMEAAAKPALPTFTAILNARKPGEDAYWVLRAVEQIGPDAVALAPVIEKRFINWNRNPFRSAGMIAWQGKQALAAIRPKEVEPKAK